MGSVVNASSKVLSRYASALAELAAEQGALPAVEKDMSELQAMLAASADLRALIAAPSVNRAERESALSEIAKKSKFHQLTTNFLMVLSANRRLNALEGIGKAFQGELARRRGEVRVSVQTVQELSAKQIKDLQTGLAKAVGSDVVIDSQINPAILGGMILTVGSHMIDDSVARKLERLKQAMNKSSNENMTHKEEVA